VACLLNKAEAQVVPSSNSEKLYTSGLLREVNGAIAAPPTKKHELIREALYLLDIKQGIEITSISDIPSQGTGLGSSSSYTVGLLNALYAYRGHMAGAERLADEDGSYADRLELFAETGIDAYHFEWQVDSKLAVEKVGHRISLVGNINNPQALLQGTPDEVHKQARYAIEARVNIIGPECAIPLATPLENLKAIVSAAHEGY